MNHGCRRTARRRVPIVRLARARGLAAALASAMIPIVIAGLQSVKTPGLATKQA